MELSVFQSTLNNTRAIKHTLFNLFNVLFFERTVIKIKNKSFLYYPIVHG